MSNRRRSKSDDDSNEHGLPQKITRNQPQLPKTGDTAQSKKKSTRQPSSKRRAEELSALLAAIVESSDDVIISCTLDGIITSWNGGAERIFGYTASEVIGRPTSILASSKAEEDYSIILEKIQRGQRIDHYQTYRRHKDSSDIAVSLTVSPVHDASGKIIGASKVARDITGLRQAEQALRNADKLALAGRMSASIAHEINNPLEAITNLFFLIQQEKISKQAQEYLDLAQSELQRVTHITSQTLSFFRGGTEPVLSQLSAIAESAISLHTGRLLVSSVVIETNYLPVSPLLCHQGEMRQMLANLIGNALDAITSKGRLYVRIRPATSTTTGARGIRLTVADTGSGMTPTTQRLLFEPFYTTKGSAGTGLGLWVTKQIVQHHKGRISVRSSQSPHHHGTVFSVFFPYLEAAPLEQVSHESLISDSIELTSLGDASRHTRAVLDQPSVAYNAA